MSDGMLMIGGLVAVAVVAALIYALNSSWWADLRDRLLSRRRASRHMQRELTSLAAQAEAEVGEDEATVEEWPQSTRVSRDEVTAVRKTLRAESDRIIKGVVDESKGLARYMREMSERIGTDFAAQMGATLKRFTELQERVSGDLARIETLRQTQREDSHALSMALAQLRSRLEKAETRLTAVEKQGRDGRNTPAPASNVPTVRWLELLGRMSAPEQLATIRLIQGAVESLDPSLPRYHAALEALTMQLGCHVARVASRAGDATQEELATALDEWMLQRFSEYELIVPRLGQGFDETIHQLESGRQVQLHEVLSITALGCWGLRERRPGGKVLYKARVSTDT